jgi:uncharacterized radical SAM superfamily Fe-S cluster-containing enzyme
MVPFIAAVYEGMKPDGLYWGIKALAAAPNAGMACCCCCCCCCCHHCMDAVSAPEELDADACGNAPVDQGHVIVVPFSGTGGQALDQVPDSAARIPVSTLGTFGVCALSARRLRRHVSAACPRTPKRAHFQPARPAKSACKSASPSTDVWNQATAVAREVDASHWSKCLGERSAPGVHRLRLVYSHWRIAVPRADADPRLVSR